MEPAQVQSLVRRVKSVTEVAGIGLDGMMSLIAGAANYGDSLGLARPVATDVGEMSALTGAGYKQAFGGSYTAFDAMSAEEVMKREVALRTRAAGSEQARFAGALIRTVDALGIGEQTEAGELASALKAGDLTFKGQSMYDVLSRNKLQDILARSGADGAGLAAFQTSLDDMFGNQENIVQYRLGNLVRQLQPTEVIRRMGAVAGEDAVQQALVARGMDVQQAAELATKAGPALLQSMIETDSPELLSSAAGRRGLIEMTLEKTIGAQGKDIAGAVSLSFESMMNEQAKLAGLGDLGKLLQSQNQTVIQQTNQTRRVAEAEAELSQLMAPLGRSGPIRRVIQMIQQGREDGQITDMLGGALNGIPIADIRKLVSSQNVLRRIAAGEEVSEEDKKVAEAARADIETIVGKIKSTAEQNGLDVGRQVSEDDFRRLSQSADEVEKSKGGGDIDSALARQLARTNNVVQALYTDDTSLRQLGAGGIEQVKGVESKYLQMLRLTGGDTELIGKALRNDESVPEELRNEIQYLHSSMTAGVAELQKKIVGGKPMSDAEWADEQKRIANFRNSRTADDVKQTDDMLGRLTTISGVEANDNETASLRSMLGDVGTDRRKDLMLAIEARETIAQAAKERGVSVRELAQDGGMRDLFAQAGSLATLCEDDQDLEDFTSVRQALEKFKPEQSDKPKDPVKIDMTGTIKMISRDEGILAGAGYTTSRGLS